MAEIGYDDSGGLNQGQEGTQDPTQITAVQRCEKWFTNSKSNMSGRRERWRKNIDLYNNKITLNWSSEAVTQLKFNLVLSTIETQMPIISDHLPTFDVMPRSSNDISYADNMNKRVRQDEASSGYKERVLDCVHDSLKLSNGMVRILPNPDGDGTRTDVVDLFTWFPSPDATGMDIRSEALYHIFATPMHVEEVFRLHGMKISPEGYLDEFGQIHLVDEDKADNKNKVDTVLLKECYYMDEDIKEYPYGRKVVWANNVLIKDEAMWTDVEHMDDAQKRIPYFMLGNYRTAHALFGIGEPELLRTQVKALDEVLSSIAETIKKTGNPVRKIKQALWNSLKKKISNVAGSEVVVNSMDDIQWETPPNIPAFTFKFIEVVLSINDIVTGVHDEIRGKHPAGVTSAVAIQTLQESAIARIRYKISKEVTPLIQQSGSFIVALLQEYDEEAREIRNIGKDGTSQFSQYDPNAKMDPNGLTEGEGFDGENAKSVRDTTFDIEVVSGTRMPTGRFAREDIAKQKFIDGIYSIEDYVNASDEPNKADMIANYYKKNGLEQLVAFQGRREKAFAKLEKLVGKALADQENFTGSDQEFALLELIRDFPDFLNTEEFMALPVEIRERVIIPAFIEGIDEYADSNTAQNAEEADGR